MQNSTILEKMKKSDNNLCPLCKGKQFVASVFGLLRCSHCSLVLNPDIWNGSANEDMVKKWFDDDYNPITSFWVRIFESLNNRRTCKGLMRYLKYSKGRKLLEVGAGSGSLLKFMKTNEFDVKGCDLSKTICNYVDREYGIQMYNCPVEELPSHELYDVVVMKHVLEHVVDPVNLLQNVKTKINRDSLLYIAVPNVFSWEARLSGWTSYEPYHLVYFNSHTFRKTLEKAGFHVVASRTHESFSGWFLSILRSVIRNREKGVTAQKEQRHNRKHSMLEHAYRVAMVLFGIASFPFRYLQGKAGYGDELIVIARPTN